MSNLVFTTGDFCSGSTLLFTVFRNTSAYYCLCEPLHERFPEYMFRPLRVYEHHFHVQNYFREYKGFDELLKLYRPWWGISRFYLSPSDEAEDLYRYLSYLINTAFKRSQHVMLKFNRVAFRLGWLRAKFPEAKVVHIYRDCDSQWNSILRRVQAYLGKDDVGQANVNFNGFNVGTWCEDLNDVFSELDAANSSSGYERFRKLWKLSFAYQQRHADLSIDYWTLTRNFEGSCAEISECIGYALDAVYLKRFVVAPEHQRAVAVRRSPLMQGVYKLRDRVERKYALMVAEHNRVVKVTVSTWQILGAGVVDLPPSVRWVVWFTDVETQPYVFGREWKSHRGRRGTTILALDLYHSDRSEWRWGPFRLRRTELHSHSMEHSL